MQEIKDINVNDSTELRYSELLLSFDCWMKYVEGFTKGIQTTETVNSMAVMDCIGEVLEYMTRLRAQLVTLLSHCENILERNAQYQEMLEVQQDEEIEDEL